MQLAVGYVVAERFRLVRELGRGGMGSVWLAEHTGLDTLCAIKFIDKAGQNSPEMRQRFEREAKAAAQLKSPHVVQVLDHGLWEGVPYIAMEYLDGEDLAHRLERLGKLSAVETHRVVSHVARALMKAHAAGIVHRDLKPENIFLIQDDELETAKVLDFGIAKRVRATVDDNGTRAGSLLGTPFYMSPEQARGTRDVDHRSDLWALGVISFQCITGQVPFSSEGLGDILAQIMFEELPVPSRRAEGLPVAFDAWWARACARQVDERFQSARDLAEALGIALGVTHSGPQPSFAQIDPTPVSTTADAYARSRTPNPDAAAAFHLAATRPGSATDPTLPRMAPVTTGNTDNPFSVTYQPDSVPQAAPSRRKPAMGLIAAGVLALGIGGFLVLRRSTHPAVAVPDPAPTAHLLTAQAPSVVIAPTEPTPEMLPPGPSAPPAASITTNGPAQARPTPTPHAAPVRSTKPTAGTASGHKKMDFGI